MPPPPWLGHVQTHPEVQGITNPLPCWQWGEEKEGKIPPSLGRPSSCVGRDTCHCLPLWREVTGCGQSQDRLQGLRSWLKAQETELNLTEFNWDSLASPVAVRRGSSSNTPDPPGRTCCLGADPSAALPPAQGGCWVVRMAAQAVSQPLESLHALGRLKYLVEFGEIASGRAKVAAPGGSFSIWERGQALLLTVIHCVQVLAPY